MTDILLHQWREKIRSPFWQKSLLLNIFLGLAVLYLLASILMISLFADTILQEMFVDQDVVMVFTGLLFYYFLFDLILRFLMQGLPFLAIQPYLTLPIRKSTLLHYPLIRSATSIFNVLALLLVTPFFIKNIIPDPNWPFSLTWLIAVLSLVAVNNFLNFSIKKYFSKKPLLPLLLIASAALLLYLDLSKTISASTWFANGIYYLSDHPLFLVIPITLGIASYSLAYHLLKRNAYIEDTQSRPTRKENSLSFLSQFGEIGQLVGVEMKLIFRNKRPRTLLIMGPIFLLYLLMTSNRGIVDNNLFAIFIGVFMTSIFSLSYGQFLFSWESSFFDFCLTSKVSTLNYIRSKYWLLMIANVACYLLTLIYGFVNPSFIYIGAAFLLFNTGITSLILIYFSTFNTSYIDLGRSQFMNYQGTTVSQFIIPFAVMAIPVITFFIFKSLHQYDLYYYSISIMGLLGIVFSKFLLKSITNQFNKRKLSMAAGFRNK